VPPSVKSVRQEQAASTRARIVDAAERVFVENGFAGARIEDVATAGGVAVPTVYKVFTNKRTLLAAVVDETMTGTQSGGVADQDWWTEQLEEPDPAEQLRLIARNARRIYDRAGAVLEVVRAAAPLDPEIAAIWGGVATDRASRARRSAKAFVAKAGGAALVSVEDTALTLLALTAPELYTAIGAAGRSPAQYERWLSHVLTASLLGPSLGPRRSRGG
jgi:AcrR family transcriptional regulator